MCRRRYEKGSVAMPGPQSFVPPPVKPSKTKRKFTLAEANRSLPLVGRIVKDVVAAHSKIVSLQAQHDRAPAKEKPSIEKEIASTMERLQNFVEELNGVGIELKDVSIGLVDFIGRHRGRDVYLCWKLGEESIGYWHELHAGFAGRQPINTLDERE